MSGLVIYRGFVPEIADKSSRYFLKCKARNPAPILSGAWCCSNYVAVVLKSHALHRVCFGTRVGRRQPRWHKGKGVTIPDGHKVSARESDLQGCPLDPCGPQSQNGPSQVGNYHIYIYIYMDGVRGAVQTLFFGPLWHRLGCGPHRQGPELNWAPLKGSL